MSPFKELPIQLELPHIETVNMFRFRMDVITESMKRKVVSIDKARWQKARSWFISLEASLIMTLSSQRPDLAIGTLT